MGGSSRVEHVLAAKNVHFFVLKSYNLNMNMSVRTFICMSSYFQSSQSKPFDIVLYFVNKVYTTVHCIAFLGKA